MGINLSPEPLVPGNDDVNLVATDDSAGARLSDARQALGLSIDQVAEQLKLSYRQITALEGNEYDKLPQMVIVRGFVRSYAKLLKIDPAPIIARLPAEHAEANLDADLRPTLATPFMESKSPFLGRADSNKKYLLGAGLLAIAALLFVVAQHFERSELFKEIFAHADQAKSEVVDSTSLPQFGVASMVDASHDAFPPDSPQQTPTVVERSAASTSEIIATQSAASTVVEVKQVQPVQSVQSLEAAAMAVAATAATSSAKPGNNQLHLKFRQDSWLQVKKETGEVVTSHLAKAGSEEFFEVKEGLQLRLGNAHGVDAWLRGAVMDIVPPKDTNVVNLNVK
ncbi:helix-turn-helix domain-containing protein [Undibacterium sp. RuRC25W]|uniref:helix-turn-helix domain-containing protein n=1 Tax=Undibacterium sp. RuRC25W TaxID=3413047 RepID=UPI003BF1557D